MSGIRPTRAGRDGQASAFMRSIGSPRAGLLILAAAEAPSDWPKSDGDVEANLNHALGWTCEVGKDHIVLLNPLGEGLVKANVPDLSPSWLDNARHDGSCALFLAPPASDAGFAELTLAAAANSGTLWAATVRTAVAEDFGAPPARGRNQPCHCGSGKKFKHCHG